MKQILFLFLVFCLSISQLFAEGVGEQRAQQMAKDFMMHKTGRQAVDMKLLTQSPINGWYVFGDSDSWVIVSGETDLYPVLAYSDEGSFSIENMPPAMQSYLDARDTQVENIRNSRTVHPENRAAWKAFEASSFYTSRSSMEPLVSTKWNQGWPYNMYCPEHSQGPGGHVYAGCVATTMSQIMKYYDYPETGRLSATYFWGENIEVDFSEGNYAWDEMTVSATTMSREAIAKLMFHCGVAVNMNYGYDGSGSNIEVAAYAMKQYFRYKSGLKFVDEADYSDSEWKFLLKEDLDKQHPIMYRGTDDGGNGHAFVCDAYQDTSYFHFNWGWSGHNDGFFTLDDQDYHWGQGAVINIMPYWGNYCNSMVYTQESWSFDDGSGPNYYWNDTDCEWLIQPEGAEQVKLAFEQFETEPGDKLYVYDGASEDAELIGTYSGSNIPSDITSSGNSLLLRFVSDSDGQTLGWKVNYESVVSGVNDELAESGISLYPNPVEDQLNIELNSSDNAVVQIVDVMGKIHRSMIVSGDKVSVDVSNLPAGMYIVKVQQSEKLSQKSFIIK